LADIPQILPLEPRLFLTVNPADMGKGDWIWYMSSARANLNVATNLEVFQNLKAKGMNWVIVKASQETSPNFASTQFDAALIKDAHRAGLKLFAYQYVTGENPAGEAAAAKTVLARGADGLVVNAEIEYQNLGAVVGGQRATTYFTSIRQDYPDTFLAHAPFPIVSLHRPFPYYEFGKYTDAVMPQDYWGLMKKTPAEMVKWQNDEWNALYASWRNTPKADAIKPLVPITQGWNEAAANFTDGPQIVEFVDLLKGLTNPATPGGYKGVSFWSVQHHTAGMWTGIGQATIGGAPTPIFSAGDTVRANGTGGTGLNAWPTSAATGTPVNKPEGSIATVTGPAVLSPDGWWRYPVRYKGDSVDRWSAEAYLALAAPPAAPIYATPGNGAGTADTTPTLDWADVAAATSYDVYVDGQLTANVATSNYTIPAALAAGGHTWQVRAKNSISATAGATWSFTVLPPAPATPGAPAPGNNAPLYVKPSLLDWADAAGATGYDVYLDGVLLGNTPNSQWTLTAPPAPKVQHVWHVVAKNAGGSTTGPDWTFRVDPIAGDANADGRVDAADLRLVATRQSQAGGWTAGDFSGDGVVGFTDFQILELSFGNTAPAAAASPAPADEVLAGAPPQTAATPVFSLTPVKPVKAVKPVVARRQ
jgi:hypothetical protein